MFVTHFQSGFNVVALVAMAARVAPIVLGFLLMVVVLGCLHRRPLSLPPGWDSGKSAAPPSITCHHRRSSLPPPSPSSKVAGGHRTPATPNPKAPNTGSRRLNEEDKQ